MSYLVKQLGSKLLLVPDMVLLLSECVCVSLKDVAGRQVGERLEDSPGGHPYHPANDHPQKSLAILVKCWPQDGVGRGDRHTLDYSHLEIEPVAQLSAKV